MKTMPQTIAEERLRWIKPIIGKKIKIKQMAKICLFSERTLKYWLANYRKQGIKGIESKSRRPRTSPNETPIRIKERVILLRKETKLCALKLHWKLKKQGIDIHTSTIGKIIKKEGLTRKYRVKRIKYKYVKVPLKPGELIEIDVKYVPGRIKSKRYYQFTAIDTASRWRYLKVYDDISTSSALKFLKELIVIAPFQIKAIKTDNGSCFTNYYLGMNKRSDLTVKTLHALDVLCKQLNIVHYLIDPGKPAQNGKVERSHRSDQETFYARNRFLNIKDLERKIGLWNMEYNNLEHCGLNGLSPNEFLKININAYCLNLNGIKVQDVCS